jgi:hypothetical protein
MRRITIGSAAALFAALLVSGTALAAKPASSSLSLVVLGSAQISAATTSTTSGATHGGQITFDINTTQTTRAFVNVRCYQDGNFVYDAWHGFFDSYFMEPIYTLSSDYWTGGGAACTARLVDGNSGKLRTLATLGFQVSG